MRLLIATLCLLAASASCATATAQQIQVRPLQLFEPLPGYVQEMDDDTYREWAMFHNEVAYRTARQRAAEYNKNVPATTVTTTTFNTNEQNQGNRGYSWGWPTIPSNTTANGERRETTRTYSRDTWGGGPVLIVNPYFRGD